MTNNTARKGSPIQVAIAHFQMDGGSYKLSKTGATAKLKGKRYRGKYLSALLARLGY